ncbi:hypothetical protein ACI2KR_08020 [Pseudomonas luteola]
MKRLPKTLLSLLVCAACIQAHADVYRFTYQLSQTIPSLSGSKDPDKEITEWTNVGEPYDCNWSPSPSQVGSGIVFTQSASCQQKQTRTNSKRVEERVTVVSAEQQSVGILESWVDGQTLFEDWIISKPSYNCMSWTPDPASYKEAATFTQSSSSCQVDEKRQGQRTEQETYTGRTRNQGDPFTEQRTLGNQQANRTYQISYTDWVNTPEDPSCASWSPDPATKPLGVAFTQSGTNCTVKQTRTRSESYTDQNTKAIVAVSSVSEYRDLSGQSASRSIMGTGTADMTPYNLTDENWVNGVARRFPGFFIKDTTFNREAYTVGRYIQYANGQIEQIVNVTPATYWLNITTSGASPLDGNIVGYPNKLKFVK